MRFDCILRGPDDGSRQPALDRQRWHDDVARMGNNGSAALQMYVTSWRVFACCNHEPGFLIGAGSLLTTALCIDYARVAGNLQISQKSFLFLDRSWAN